MRSLACCGVSRTVWARMGDASTSIPSTALLAKQHSDAPSLPGCMRIDDPPSGLYRQKAQVHQGFPELRCRLLEGDADGEDWGISAVAKWAMRKNSSPFAGMCRLKSTKLCMRKQAEATRPESCRVTEDA